MLTLPSHFKTISQTIMDYNNIKKKLTPLVFQNLCDTQTKYHSLTRRYISKTTKRTNLKSEQWFPQ